MPSRRAPRVEKDFFAWRKRENLKDEPDEDDPDLMSPEEYKRLFDMQEEVRKLNRRSGDS